MFAHGTLIVQVADGLLEDLQIADKCPLAPIEFFDDGDLNPVAQHLGRLPHIVQGLNIEPLSAYERFLLLDETVADEAAPWVIAVPVADGSSAFP